MTSLKRYSPMPEVPTVAESGLPGYVVESFYIVAAPGGTPRAILDKLNAELRVKLKDPAFSAHMAADGAEVIAASIADSERMLKEDYARWAKPVKDSGAQVD